MSYIPLYSQSTTVPSNSSSIWAPIQHKRPASSHSSWSCMPTVNIHPNSPKFYNESLTTTKNLGSNPSFALLDHTDRRSLDVFGPVMSNDFKHPSLSTQLKKNVGAVGDRRFNHESKQHTSEHQDSSDNCSAVR